MLTNKDMVFVLSMGGLGLLLLFGGLLARFGFYKSLYAMRGNPVFAPPALTYIIIPGSIVFFMFAITPFLPTMVEVRQKYLAFIIFPYQFVLISLTIWRPWWLKPKWLRWLEKEHGAILELLWEDVREDRWGWERRVKTQKDLETWVNEVRRKHGLE